MVAKNKFLEFGDGLAAAAMIAAEAASLHRRERARQIPAKTMWPAILLTMGEARAIAGTPGKDAWIGRVAIRHRRRFALHGGLPESCTRKLRLPLSNWRRSWRGEPGRNADRGLSRSGAAVWTGWGRDHSLHRNVACLVGKGFPAFGKRAGPGPRISVLATSGRQSDHATSSIEV